LEPLCFFSLSLVPDCARKRPGAFFIRALVIPPLVVHVWRIRAHFAPGQSRAGTVYYRL
jgi:hypothetical protein